MRDERGQRVGARLDLEQPLLRGFLPREVATREQDPGRSIEPDAQVRFFRSSRAMLDHTAPNDERVILPRVFHPKTCDEMHIGARDRVETSPQRSKQHGVGVRGQQHRVGEVDRQRRRIDLPFEREGLGEQDFGWGSEDWWDVSRGG